MMKGSQLSRDGASARTMMPGAGELLAPIENKPSFVKRIKNSWSDSIELLQDLKTKRNVLFNQL
jgi:hypothetical protein